MAPEEGGRRERKFFAPRAAPADLEALLRRLPGLFRPEHPPRRVASLYLDTPDRADYRACADGISPRRKLRLRWYGEDFGRFPRAFEVKRRDGLLVRKRVYPLSESALDAGSGKRAELLTGLPAEPRALAAVRGPVVLVAYARSYFRSADGAVRATVDGRLSLRRWSARGFGPSRRLPGAVLELKYAPAEEDAALAAARGLPLRLSRHSKYCRAVEAIFA